MTLQDALCNKNSSGLLFVKISLLMLERLHQRSKAENRKFPDQDPEAQRWPGVSSCPNFIGCIPAHVMKEAFLASGSRVGGNQGRV